MPLPLRQDNICLESYLGGLLGLTGRPMPESRHGRAGYSETAIDARFEQPVAVMRTLHCL